MRLSCKTLAAQWRNVRTVTPAKPEGGRRREGAQNRPKMWENFATLIARLAKSRVFVDK